jgi:chemotaxis protein histidine kinase CheA
VVYWYRKAAEQGYASAQNSLGWVYENGQGVKQDYKKAVYWYRKAAEQSNNYAQSNLGTMYRDGKGVEQNYNKSVYWYTMAIVDGSVTAQVKLDRLNKRIAKEEKEQLTKALLVSILLIFILVAAKDKIKTKFEQYRAKTKAKAQAKDEAYAISVAKAAAEYEARKKAEAAEAAEKKARIIAEDEARKKAKAAEEEARKEAEEEKKLAKEKLDSDLINLHNSLPFYTRNKSDEFSSSNGDDSRWFFVLEAIKKCYTDDTTLYLVKVKSLNDDNEYYKIGVTTQSIASRFLKSPDSELVEVIASRLMEKRLALFAEFHFIREFRPKESPNEGKGFSGYTEIVKENSIKKIKSLFSTLPEYEAKASSFLSLALTDKS